MTDQTGFAPWAPGDIFLGATQLDDPDDDHAGRGRILQLGPDLEPKGSLELEATTHLVGGLRFDADGVLWAFDSQEFVVLNIHADGRVEVRDFPKRSFSHVNFHPDGSLLLGEHAVGDSIRPEIAARMHTRLPFMPGTTRFGDGHVFRFEADGTPIKEYATDTQGGMGGFLGVTMSALTPDGKRLVYCSETGPRLMQYDLEAGRQLPDLQAFAPPWRGPPEMFFGMAYGSDGTLYVLRGGRIDVVDAAGATLRSIPLEGFGWALLEPCIDGRHALVGSFFSGEIVRIALDTGEKVGSYQSGAVKSLAGLAEYRGR